MVGRRHHAGECATPAAFCAAPPSGPPAGGLEEGEVITEQAAVQFQLTLSLAHKKRVTSDYSIDNTPMKLET